MTGMDLIKPSPIEQHLNLGTVTAELADDGYEEEKAKWLAGGTVKDHAVVAALTADEGNRKLIDLHTVITRAGVVTKGGILPRLAIAPAFSDQTRMRIRIDGELDYRVGHFPRQWRYKMDFDRVWSGDTEVYERVASVPRMPPDMRALATPSHLILWEANWRKNASKAAAAPVVQDPALLEHVSGSLYIVRGTWELTALEAAALK